MSFAVASTNAIALKATQGSKAQPCNKVAARAFTASVRGLQSNRVSLSASRRALAVVAGDFAPPTVSSTKDKFMQGYKKPIPAMYNTVLQELLVMQHMNRYNINYEYNGIMALGFTSVFDQIFDEYKMGPPEEIFSAYIEALCESPETYRGDSERLATAAAGASSVSDIAAMDEVKAMAAQAAEGKLQHTKYAAIGLFRMLELAGLTDPSALDELVKESGMDKTLVSRDLLTYKGLLSKLNATKELQREFIEREQKKTAERAAAKAQKAETATAAAAESDSAN